MIKWTDELRSLVGEHLDAGESQRVAAKKITEETGIKITWQMIKNQLANRTIPLTYKGNRLNLVSKTVINSKEEFEREGPPPEEQSIEDLIAERKRKFEFLHAHKSYSPIPIRIKIDGPIGVAHFGDPHIDDNGSDLDTLFRHMEIVKKTKGMLAGNIGDTHNNWIGRLAHLHSQQSVSSREAWKLTEYFLRQTPWLYLIGGNHDCWSGDGDPIEWIIGDTYTRHGSRLKLKFPNGREALINARHDFRGHSQWNTTHAIGKAAQMGWDDDILVGGHKHVSGYTVVRNPKNGVISHCIQVASYKVHDEYAEKLGLNDKTIFQCPVTIINPHSTNPVNLVHVIFDPEEAAEYLTWLRKKYQ